MNRLSIGITLGGPKEVEKLESFMVSYMDSDGGWENVEPYLLGIRSKKAQQVYVKIAVYIDKSAKPIISELFNREVLGDVSEDRGLCEMAAMARLASLGIDMKVSEMVDAMTGGGGGALEGLELIAGAASLLHIWLDYEICKGRWH
ncbi:MAG: hypothetical protein HDR83_05160 [Bacteroides sp.]|nr:hypothetical protein [Bacteroides sp.]